MVSERRAWAYLLLYLLALAVAAVLVAAEPANSSRYSVRLTHRVDVTVQRALHCRAQLGRTWPVRRRYARRSSRWRRGALRVWTRRLNRCRPEARRVGVPPWFRRVMLCVHPKESANWFLDGHHDGGLQFNPGTWAAAMARRRAVYGLPPLAAYAYQASPNEQIRAAWDLTGGSHRGIRHHWRATIGGCL